MFRIFENWDGSFTVMPYEPGDDLITLGFGLIFVLLMSVVAGYASLYMALPVIALYISVLIDMYVHDEAAALISYPFAAYAWGGTCYAVMEATRVHGLGLLGLAGWVIMAIVAIVLLIVPLGERTGMEFVPAMTVIPLGMVWIGSLLYGLSDESNSYAKTSANLCKYAFRLFGIMMAAGIAIAVYHCLKRSSFRSGEKATVNSFFNLIIGCLIVAGGCAVSSVAGGKATAVYTVAAFAILSVFTRGRKLLSLNELSLLPCAVCLVLDPLTRYSSSDILPLSAADHIIRFSQARIFRSVSEQFTSPLLEGMEWAVSKGLRALINLILMIFDTSVPAFSIPLLLMSAVTFVILCVSASIGRFGKRK